MANLGLKIALGLGVTAWLALCIFLYRLTRKAAWLAGSTVASCLCLLGAAVAASTLVKGALYLLPLWAGILLLSGAHLHAALRRPEAGDHGSVPRERADLFTVPVGSIPGPEEYI